jgi:hypothetical protein
MTSASEYDTPRRIEATQTLYIGHDWRLIKVQFQKQASSKAGQSALLQKIKL